MMLQILIPSHNKKGFDKYRTATSLNYGSSIPLKSIAGKMKVNGGTPQIIG
jgi:hypothetical protein